MNRGTGGLSRRQLLSAVGAAGAFSAVGGAATGAYLNDQEGGLVEMRAGEVRLRVDCAGDSCVETEDGVGFRFEDLKPGSTGEERFHLSIDGNPARVWLRTTCPSVVDPLASSLLVRLSLEERGDGAGGRRLFPGTDDATERDWGTLEDMRETLVDGIRLDAERDPCLSGDDDVSLHLEYELPSDAAWAGDAETRLEFRLFAEQCRHVPEADVENPFGDDDCRTPGCPACVELGKIESENDRLEVGRHEFDELASPFRDDGHRYAVDVLTETVKEADRPETICVAVRLLRDGSELGAPPICEVAVAGGSDTGSKGGGWKRRQKGGIWEYLKRWPGPTDESSAEERASDAGEPGSDVETRGSDVGTRGSDTDRRTRGPNTTTYDVEPPTTRTRGEVCTAETEAGRSGARTRPAISHVTVSVCPGASENGGDER